MGGSTRGSGLSSAWPCMPVLVSLLVAGALPSLCAAEVLLANIRSGTKVEGRN